MSLMPGCIIFDERAFFSIVLNVDQGRSHSFVSLICRRTRTREAALSDGLTGFSRMWSRTASRLTSEISRLRG